MGGKIVYFLSEVNEQVININNCTLKESRMNLLSKCLFIISLLTPIFLQAQTITELDQRADSIIKFRDMMYNTPSDIHHIENSAYFWYKKQTKNGKELWLVDTKSLKKKQAFDKKQLLALLNTNKEKKHTLNDLRNISFEKDLTEIHFLCEGVNYVINLKKYKILSKDKQETKPEMYWGEATPDPTDAQIFSPDSQRIAYIMDYNLYVKNQKNNKVVQLSYDGSEGEYYSSHITWSPNSKLLITNKVKANIRRTMQFMESSPNDQLLPKLHTLGYLRPGDALPISQPSLFNVAKEEQIPIDCSPYLNQFSIDNIKWNPDNKYFTFEFNQRGHQVYKIIKVNAQSGETHDLVTEQFKTFFDYSGKRYRYDIESTQELIWASERDGYNHLYLFDKKTGNLTNQITNGDWVVRSVVHVDTIKRQIIFTGSGMNKNEDPYYIHYYRINFNGSKLTDLTPEKCEHKAVFNDDYSLFIDTYSKVDKAPITVLRSAKNGKVKMEIEKADIDDLLNAGYIFPEPFVAKGRDGKTDIWGNIYRPTNFDSTKTYPIIEYIYAGPHSSFVQKSFSTYHYAYSGLAELGFIIVSIDGMGTSNRSKAFHDVCYKNLKDAGFPDRILWIKTAAEKYSYMDTTHIGIFGGSAGGQSSTGALLFHPEFYKVAVSSCGCHDNRVDKIWWNEQWMGTIGKHYEDCSNITHAKNLKGHLMLIVGEMDNNVDPASTMQLANALIKNNKDFELVVLPGVSHTLGGHYGEMKRRAFFVKHLKGIDYPNRNTK